MKKRRRKNVCKEKALPFLCRKIPSNLKKNILNITINLNGNNVIIKLIDECKL